MNIMKFFAVTAVAVIAVSSFAQGGGGGRGGFGGGQFGRGGFGGMQDPSGVFLLNRDDVATEIKLSADQKSKLDSIRQAQREKTRGQRGWGGIHFASSRSSRPSAIALNV